MKPIHAIVVLLIATKICEIKTEDEIEPKTEEQKNSAVEVSDTAREGADEFSVEVKSDPESETSDRSGEERDGEKRTQRASTAIEDRSDVETYIADDEDLTVRSAAEDTESKRSASDYLGASEDKTVDDKEKKASNEDRTERSGSDTEELSKDSSSKTSDDERQAPKEETKNSKSKDAHDKIKSVIKDSVEVRQPESDEKSGLDASKIKLPPTLRRASNENSPIIETKARADEIQKENEEVRILPRAGIRPYDALNGFDIKNPSQSLTNPTLTRPGMLLNQPLFNMQLNRGQKQYPNNLQNLPFNRRPNSLESLSAERLIDDYSLSQTYPFQPPVKIQPASNQPLHLPPNNIFSKLPDISRAKSQAFSHATSSQGSAQATSHASSQASNFNFNRPFPNTPQFPIEPKPYGMLPNFGFPRFRRYSSEDYNPLEYRYVNHK